MSDPVPAVTEADATGQTAAIFADIRAVYGVSVVNLIWRHLATFPGALPWAWSLVRPLYIDGTIAREAEALRAERSLPEVPRVPAEVFDALGLRADDVREIGIVLDAYERTNPMALIALSVVERHLAGSVETTPVSAVVQPIASETELRLPKLLTLGEMSPQTAALVTRLNQFGATRPDPVLASMYRTLAHWPPYLGLIWAMLDPPEREGHLAAAIAITHAQAQARAGGIAGRALGVSSALPPEQRVAVTAALDRFTGDAICRMVVICGLVRRATLSD